MANERVAIDVNTLAETVREAHSKAMEALGADVHPYSASAIRDWEQTLDAALTDLAAIACDYADYLHAYIDVNERLQAAEADLDRLARRVAELERGKDAKDKKRS